MTEPTRVWADVYLAPTPDRYALEAAALFFIPDAFLTLRGRHKMTATGLGAVSRVNRRPGGPNLAGKAAITKVLNLQPVAYASAEGFLPVANLELKKLGVDRTFTTRDIVACVFRLADFETSLTELEMTPESLAKASKVSLPIVQAALLRYRVSFADAKAIWDALREAHVAKGTPKTEADKARHKMLASLREFIRTDARQPLGVKAGESERTVYRSEDLRAAPKGHHPWALIDPTDD